MVNRKEMQLSKADINATFSKANWFLKNWLAREIEQHRIDPTTANNYIATLNNAWEIYQRMDHNCIRATELIEWIENAEEIRTGIVTVKTEVVKK